MVARLGIGSIPFLVPLFLQVGLGYPADIAGLLMLAPAMASIMTKTVVLRVLGRFGYRNTLLFLTFSIAGVFMLTALQRPGWSMLPIVTQLFVQGMLMSGQFTAMNTITLGDVPAGNGKRRQQPAFRLPESESQLRGGHKHRAAAAFFRHGNVSSGSARNLCCRGSDDGGRRLCIYAAAP